MSYKAVVSVLVAAGLVTVFAAGRAFGQFNSEPAVGQPVTPGAAWAAPANPKDNPALIRRTGPWTPEEVTKWQDDQKKLQREQLRKELGATEDEWKVLGPKVDKVQAFSQELAWWRFSIPARIGVGTAAQDAPAPKPTDDLKAKFQALRDAVADKDHDPKDIAQKLAAVRDARERVKADLIKTQSELKELLTPRQEAQLFVKGTID